MKKQKLKTPLTNSDVSVPERWKPCGEGENICNCKKASECGYIEIYKRIARMFKSISHTEK